MNFQPDLVVDDARATGWARVEIYGDKDKGRALIAAGRSVLGGLKSQTGTNQQQVEDRETTGGGGFHHRWQTLSDGSKIHAMTNDGHDTIRIYTASAGAEKKKKDLDADGRAPYLWVGLRRIRGGGICNDDDIYNGYLPTAHLYVWEPEQENAEPGSESQILSGRHLDNTIYSEVEYPLRDTDSITVTTTDIYGDEVTRRINYTNNGMYHMPAELVFDPQDPDQTEHGPFYWDQCILLDPSRGNDGISSSSVLLEDSAVHKEGIDKVEKLSSSGDEPDTREWLSQIPGCNYLGAGYQIGCVFKHDSCQAPSPSEWLLEVRLGRDPYQLVQQYQFTITHYTPRFNDLYPYGFWNADGSSDELTTGPNHHADGWWPTTIDTDPKWSALSDSEAQDQWPRGFEEGEAAAWRPYWCASNHAAQLNIVPVQDRATAINCSDFHTTIYLVVQAFGFQDTHVPLLFGHQTFPNPCTGLPPPAQSITGSFGIGGGTFTWPGIVSSRPHSHNGDSGVVGGAEDSDLAYIGFIDVATEGPWQGRGILGSCTRDQGPVEQAFEAGVNLEFHAWWDESGFHTGPGHV